MKFGPVPVDEAEGAILAHSVDLGSGRLRKGRWVSAADVSALRAAGLTCVTVARLDESDVHEDAAADRLAVAILSGGGSGLRASKAATGRVNLYAEHSGIVEVSTDAIHALNAIHPMITLATVPEWQRMGSGGMVATVKMISYAVPEAELANAISLAVGVLRLRAPTVARATLIQTVVPGDDGETGHEAVAARLAALGIPMTKAVVPHREGDVAAALRAAEADILLILTGSATSDLHDTAPEALRQAGGAVIRYGMPVDPGNLLFLGDLGGTPVIGLPGCARSPALNGADWVLERVACGVPVTDADIAAMGVGGLLKEIPTRPAPRERRPVRQPPETT
ncbi:MAG: molybdopterin-binding protein [Pseudomonadota bacterium]